MAYSVAEEIPPSSGGHGYGTLAYSLLPIAYSPIRDPSIVGMTTARKTKLTVLSLRGGGSRRGNPKVDSNVTFFLDKKSNQSAAADKTWIFFAKKVFIPLKDLNSRGMLWDSL